MIVLFCANGHHESDQRVGKEKCSKQGLHHLQMNKGEVKLIE